MFNYQDHNELLNLSKAYLEMREGYKKFPAAKVQDQAAMKPDTAKGESQARKMDKVRAVMTDNETGYGNAARQFNKRAPVENQKRGLEKKFKKPAVAGHEGAARAKMGMAKDTPKRPKTRMPKADRPGTIKK